MHCQFEPALSAVAGLLWPNLAAAVTQGGKDARLLGKALLAVAEPRFQRQHGVGRSPRPAGDWTVTFAEAQVWGPPGKRCGTTNGRGSSLRARLGIQCRDAFWGLNVAWRAPYINSGPAGALPAAPDGHLAICLLSRAVTLRRSLPVGITSFVWAALAAPGRMHEWQWRWWSSEMQQCCRQQSKASNAGQGLGGDGLGDGAWAAAPAGIVPSMDAGSPDAPAMIPQMDASLLEVPGAALLFSQYMHVQCSAWLASASYAAKPVQRRSAKACHSQSPGSNLHRQSCMVMIIVTGFGFRAHKMFSLQEMFQVPRLAF